MIQYNLERLILLRGHNKPIAFLQQNGYSYHKSHRMLSGKTQITFKELFDLCQLLRCTPNDLMELVPDKKQPLDADHPLQALRRNIAKEASLQALLKSVPADKVDQALELIGDLCKEP
jgi:DNA-binding Xre family transcriptional regulator